MTCRVLVPAECINEEDNKSDSDLDCRVDNLKITVLPEITIGAGLNGHDFDIKLEPKLLSWFKEFHIKYHKYKNALSTQQELVSVFMDDPDPLTLALKLFALSPGCVNFRSRSLAVFVLETVCNLFYTKVDNMKIDDNVRMVAFNFVKTCGIVSLYKAVTRTYTLNHIRELLKPKLKLMLKLGYYKDVADWCMLLNLTDMFGIFDLIVPLVLQYSFLVDEYLSIADHLQLSTVQFLDTWLDKKKPISEHCQDILQKYNYPNIKDNKLSYRCLSKMVSRLVKRFKIDFRFTPNLMFSRSSSYLRFLHKRYKSGETNIDSWRELAKEETNRSIALQYDLIKYLTNNDDLDEAFYWLNYYKIPIEECNATIQIQLKKILATKKIQSPEHCTSKNNTVSIRQSDDYLKIQVPIRNIILVDNKSKFLHMLNELDKYSLIAFDSEWKPSIFDNNVVSLLQLATDNWVFLIDCLTPELDIDLWKLLNLRIFNNTNILKIGFALNQDVKMVQTSLNIQMIEDGNKCFLDMKRLWNRLKYMNNFKFPFNQLSAGGESLTVLTELCLGKKLDKSNQCSNWDKRPLRKDQILYAALDAYCLIQIFHVITGILWRLGININNAINEICLSKINSSNSDESGIITSTMELSNSKRNMQNIHSFIVDSMLLGLSKELRKLGFDCIEVEKDIKLEYYINRAKREKRIILTRDSRYLLFSKNLPLNQCIEVPTDKTGAQVINLLQYLRIKVNVHNMYTRCLMCNENEFILANRNDMQLMRFGCIKDVGNPLPPYRDMCFKTWKIMEIGTYNITARKTFRGKCINVRSIYVPTLFSVDYFYICNNCGVCTWDGANHVQHDILSHIMKSTKYDKWCILPESCSEK